VTDRQFRFLFAAALLAALYFASQPALDALIGLLFVEGVSGRRLSVITTRLRYRGGPPPCRACDLSVSPAGPAIPFDAERAWRLVVGTMLLLACTVFPVSLWFLPWFMGFAILGAGLSGVCPVLLALQWTGFRYAPPA